MTERQTVTGDDLRKARMQFVIHVNLGGRGGYSSYRVLGVPEATVFSGQQKVKGQMRPFKYVQVTDAKGERAEFDMKHLDLAAEAINRIRRGEADEAAWEAAAPAPVAAGQGED